MAFTEKQEYKIEVLPPYKTIQCRRTDIVLKDNVVVGRTYHRHTRVPGEDLTNETCEELKTIANAIWTTDVINNYKNSLTE